MRALLESPERREGLGTVGRETVIDRYSADRMAEGIESVYEGVVNSLELRR
jgi:glycosyltransferase involved in cell wall biosynthesis